MKPIDPMTDLEEATPYLPIDDNVDPKYWEGVALPLVRRVFAELEQSRSLSLSEE